MKTRGFAAFLAAVLLLLSLTACNPLDSAIDDLITPPQQSGNGYPIQQALKTAAGGDITLKYPVTGEYRSAFSFVDIDADGFDEAIATYSSTVDGTVSMHLNVIDYENEKWVSKSDAKIVGNGVEKLVFRDLDGDSRPEIIVGWMIYGTVNKQVGVYSYTDKGLAQRILENYTDFLCDTIEKESNAKELIVLNLDTTAKTSVIKVLTLGKDGVTERGSALLDGGVTSYSAPVISTLKGGQPAIYIDAVKGAGSLTEIVWFDGGTLKSTYDSTLGETAVTYRPTVVNSGDINGDKIPDVPIMNLLLSTADKSDADKVYVTAWSNFDGKKLASVKNTLMNYTDGYYLTVKKEWQSSLYLARKLDTGLRTFYSYDEKLGVAGSEVFRIITVAEDDISSGKFDDTGYETLGSSSGRLYLTKIVPENELGVTFDELKENFFIIGG